MREIRSYGSVGEPVGNHRLYPDGRAPIRQSAVQRSAAEPQPNPLQLAWEIVAGCDDFDRY